MVLHRIENKSNSFAKYETRCDCGSLYHAYGYLLRRGTTSRCRKCGYAKQAKTIRDNLVGRRFGTRMVLKLLGRGRGHNTRYEAVCDCGAVESVSRHSLLQSKSCRQCWLKSAKIFPNQAITKRFQGYKTNASNRGIEFYLTPTEFIKLGTKFCSYCGEPPRSVKYRGHEGIFTGIDRTDSNGHYTLDNVVPCCDRCNWLKSDYSVESFLSHVHRIAQHQGWIPRDTKDPEEIPTTNQP